MSADATAPRGDGSPRRRVHVAWMVLAAIAIVITLVVAGLSMPTRLATAPHVVLTITGFTVRGEDRSDYEFAYTERSYGSVALSRLTSRGGSRTSPELFSAHVAGLPFATWFANSGSGTLVGHCARGSAPTTRLAIGSTIDVGLGGDVIVAEYTTADGILVQDILHVSSP